MGRGRVAAAVAMRLATAGVAAAVVCLALSAPASAASPQDVADLTAGLGRLATVTRSLTSPGLLGRPLALTSVTAGAADGIGFEDLFAAATVNRLSSPQSLSDLADQLSGTASLSGGRSATITATAIPAPQGSTVEGIDLTIDVTRHRSGIPLWIASSSPPLSIQSADGATDDLTATTQLSLRYDTATRDVWLDGAPSLALDAAVTARPGAKAGLGILGVVLDQPQTGPLLASNSHFSAAVGTPQGGKVTVLKADTNGDLVPAALKPTALSAGFDPARKSTLSGSVQLTADTSGWNGLGSLSGVSGTIGLNAPDLASGDPPAVDTSGLSQIIGFTALKPADLVASLQQLAGFLRKAQVTTIPAAGGKTLGDVALPFMKGRLSDTFDASEALTAFVNQHGSAGPNGTPDFFSLQQMLGELAATSSGGASVSVANLSWSAQTGKLAYDLHLHGARSDIQLDPNAGKANDPQTGLVDFGALLTKAAGINGLTAQQAGASASPVYDVTVTPVLNMSANAPGGTNRSLLRTGSSMLTADVPVMSDVDAAGTAGALALHTAGQLQVKAPDSGHMQALDLKTIGDQQHDVTVGQLLASLSQSPDTVLTAANSGSAKADMTADVPGTPSFFGNADDVTAELPDLTDPSSVTANGGAITTLKAFSQGGSAQVTLAKVEAGLRTLSDSMGKLSQLAGGSAGALYTTIPLLGKAPGDLIDTDALDAAIASLAGKAPASLDDLAAALNAKLGAGSSIKFSTGVDSNGQPILLAHVVQHKAIDRHVPLDMSLGPTGAGASVLTGISSSGQLHLTGAVDADITLAIDLGGTASPDSPSNLKVLPDSSLAVKLTVDGSGTIAANLGPFFAKLGNDSDPSVLHAAVDLALGDLSPGSDAVSFSQWASALAVQLNQHSSPVHCTSADAGTTLDVCASLPLYLSHDGGQTYDKVSQDGNNNFNLRLPADDPSFDPFGPDIAGPNGSIKRFEQPDGLAAAMAGAALDFHTLKWGADQFFTLVENGLTNASGAGLPIVGSDLEEGHQFVQGLQQHVDDAFDALPPSAGLSVHDLKQTIADQLSQRLGSTLQSAVTINATCKAGPCNDDDPATDVVRIAIDFNAGSTSGDLSHCTDQSAGCAGFSIPLDVGLPGISLHSDQQLSGAVGWNLHVAFGLDTRGFFAEPGNKLQVGIGVNAPQNLNAMLSFLNVKVTDLNNGSVPAFSGVATVALNNGQDLYDLGALGPGIIDASLSADAKADWHIEATADSAFPGIAADFHLRWSLTNPDAAPSLIRFDNVAVVPGSIVQGVLGPVARTLNSALAPVHPVVSFLNEPIPVIDWLANAAGYPPPTVVSLLGIAGDLSGDQRVTMAHRVLQISTIADNVLQAASNDQPIPIGGFDVDPSGAMVGAPPSSELKNEQLTAGSDFKSKLLNAAFPASKDAGLLNDFLNQDDSGFSFPAFDDPSKLLGLLLGQDVDIAKYDAGKLQADLNGGLPTFDISDVAPISVGAFATAHLDAQFRAGFDTYGIRNAIANGKTADIFNGLYISTVDADGNETPNLKLSGRIGVFAEASAAIASITVSGGLSLDASLGVTDSDGDHKFRPSNLGAISKGLGCVFAATANSNVFLKITGSLSYGLGSVDTDIVDFEHPILDLTSSCPPGGGGEASAFGGGVRLPPPPPPIGTYQALPSSVGLPVALNDAGDVLTSDGKLWSSKNGSISDFSDLGSPRDLNDAGEALIFEPSGKLVVREPNGTILPIPQSDVYGSQLSLSDVGRGDCGSLVYGITNDGHIFVADPSESTTLPTRATSRDGHEVPLVHLFGGNSSGEALAQGQDDEAYVWRGARWVDVGPADFVAYINNHGDVLAGHFGDWKVFHPDGSATSLPPTDDSPHGLNDAGDVAFGLPNVYHDGHVVNLRGAVSRDISSLDGLNDNGQLLGTTRHDHVLITIPDWANKDASKPTAQCTPPEPPLHVDAERQPGGSTQLTWDAPETTRSVTGYAVYRYENADKSLVRIASLDPGTRQAVDPQPLQDGHYVVTATGLGGESSGVIATPATGVAKGAFQPGTPLDLTLPNGHGTLHLPPDLASTPTAFKYREPAPEGDPVPGDFAFGGQSFSITAIDQFGNEVHRFDDFYTLVIHYDPASLPAGTPESTLKLRYFDSTGWHTVADQVLDTTAHTITAQLNHLTEFALMVPTSAPATPPGGAPSGPSNQILPGIGPVFPTPRALKSATAGKFDYSALRHKHSFSLTVTNPNALEVGAKLALGAQAQQGKGKHRRTVKFALGNATTTLPAGASRKVTLKLSRSAVSKLLHARRPTVSLTVTTSAAGLTAVTKKMAIRIPLAPLRR